MDLWIRNQDKTRLTMVNDLYLVHDENNACDYIGSNMVGHLAKYTTPGRALEVLDEIQEAQLENYHYRCPSNVKVSNNENTIVYEMPKE